MRVLHCPGMGNYREQLAKVTPNRNELRFEVFYDQQGPLVDKAHVVHHYTGVIQPLSDMGKEMLRQALYARQLAERAQADLSHLESNFGKLIETLGRENPSVSGYVQEAARMGEFIEVAQQRSDTLMSKILKLTDEIAEQPANKAGWSHAPSTRLY